MKKDKDAALRKMNKRIWKRDKGRCINCGSTNIYGHPFKSGAHHILSRAIAPTEYSEEKNLCLLCVKCHSSDADTTSFRKILFGKMKMYNYDYTTLQYKAYL